MLGGWWAGGGTSVEWRGVECGGWARQSWRVGWRSSVTVVQARGMLLHGLFSLSAGSLRVACTGSWRLRKLTLMGDLGDLLLEHGNVEEVSQSALCACCCRGSSCSSTAVGQRCRRRRGRRRCSRSRPHSNTCAAPASHRRPWKTGPPCGLSKASRRKRMRSTLVLSSGCPTCLPTARVAAAVLVLSRPKPTPRVPSPKPPSTPPPQQQPQQRKPKPRQTVLRRRCWMQRTC
jgi:hypothetical protein